MLPQIPQKYRAAERWSFGDNEALADELANKVIAGVKTATCANLDDEGTPEVGEVFLVVDGLNNPVCAVKLTEVKQVPFDLVTEEHALAEGEGDGTLATWRADQQRFFEAYDMFAPDMPLLLMKFTLVEKF